MAQHNARTLTLTASGTTWSQYKTGGIPLILLNLIAANVAKANPAAAATATATGGGASGGLLPAGNYFFAYANCDAFGETTLGASEIASAITVASTNIPRITMPALPTGVDSRNIYATLPGGASGTERLYATGVTGTTFDLAFAASVDSPYASFPTINTTGADTNASLINRFVSDGTPMIMKMIADESNYLGGVAAEMRDIVTRTARHEAAFLLWKTAFTEARTLKMANLGSWTYAPGASGIHAPFHTLP